MFQVRLNLALEVDDNPVHVAPTPRPQDSLRSPVHRLRPEMSAFPMPSGHGVMHTGAN